MRLQAWLNWQIRYAGRELTTTQLRQFSDLFGDDAIGVYDDGWRDPRQGAPHRRHPHLGRVLPFRDNLDHAKPQPGSQ